MIEETATYLGSAEEQQLSPYHPLHDLQADAEHASQYPSRTHLSAQQAGLQAFRGCFLFSAVHHDHFRAIDIGLNGLEIWNDSNPCLYFCFCASFCCWFYLIGDHCFGSSPVADHNPFQFHRSFGLLPSSSLDQNRARPFLTLSAAIPLCSASYQSGDPYPSHQNSKHPRNVDLDHVSLADGRKEREIVSDDHTPAVVANALDGRILTGVKNVLGDHTLEATGIVLDDHSPGAMENAWDDHNRSVHRCCGNRQILPHPFQI